MAKNKRPTNQKESVPLHETLWWKRNKHRVLVGFRHKVGLTQKELSRLSGIRQSVISELENGKRPMTLKTAIKLADFLKVKPEQLLADSASDKFINLIDSLKDDQENENHRFNLNGTSWGKKMGINRAGNLIAGARHKLGLTQKQLAAKMEISQNTIRDYEKGRRKLTPAIAEKFEKALDIRVFLLNCDDI